MAEASADFRGDKVEVEVAVVGLVAAGLAVVGLAVMGLAVERE